MGLLHLIQGVVVLVISKDFVLPITTNYLEFNASLGFPVPTTRDVFEIQVASLVALFFFLSATAHLLISMPRIFEWYEKNLQRNINFARWYEYSLSSSVMIVAIALLTGIYDSSTLILMFALNASMIFFGLVMELHNQTTKKTDWTAFIFGCFAGIVPWIVLALHFFNALADASGNVPTFVYFILGSLFIFFNVFAINMYLQYKKVGPWKNYLYGEYAYIILSLIAKSALAWQVFGGTLR